MINKIKKIIIKIMEKTTKITRMISNKLKLSKIINLLLCLWIDLYNKKNNNYIIKIILIFYKKNYAYLLKILEFFSFFFEL